MKRAPWLYTLMQIALWSIHGVLISYAQRYLAGMGMRDSAIGLLLGGVGLFQRTGGLDLFGGGGDLQSFRRGHDAELLALGTDQADLLVADLLIQFMH